MIESSTEPTVALRYSTPQIFYEARYRYRSGQWVTGVVVFSLMALTFAAGIELTLSGTIRSPFKPTLAILTGLLLAMLMLLGWSVFYLINDRVDVTRITAEGVQRGRRLVAWTRILWIGAFVSPSSGVAIVYCMCPGRLGSTPFDLRAIVQTPGITLEAFRQLASELQAFLAQQHSNVTVKMEPIDQGWPAPSTQREQEVNGLHNGADRRETALIMQVPSSGMIMTLPDACYRCEYNLTGIADDQPCPECGLLAARSRRSSDDLHQSRPRWLRKLSIGIWLILVAGVFPVGAYPLLVGILMWGDLRPGSFGGSWFESLIYSPLDVSAVLIWAGVLLLSAREDYPPADLSDRRLRIFLRFAGATPLIALLLLQWSVQRSMAGWRGYGSFSVMELAALIVGTVGTTPLPILIGLRLRSLAKRVHSPQMAEHCLIVGFGVSLTLVYIFIYYLIGEYADRWGLGTHFTNGRTWMMFTLTFAVLSILFILWNGYLLIRFAVAFGSASLKLRQKWLIDDRSQLPGQRVS